MRERWKAILGYEGYYEASDHGRVRSLDRVVDNGRGWTARRKGRLLSPGRNVRGYLLVVLHKDGRGKSCTVHALVLRAFFGPRPSGMECRHLNGMKDDNRLGNLTWGSAKENSADRIRHGTQAMGERHGSSKLTEEDVIEIRSRLARGEAGTALAKEFGVRHQQIYGIKNLKAWTHV